jgi:hypothetical protein
MLQTSLVLYKLGVPGSSFTDLPTAERWRGRHTSQKLPRCRFSYHVASRGITFAAPGELLRYPRTPSCQAEVASGLLR